MSILVLEIDKDFFLDKFKSFVVDELSFSIVSFCYDILVILCTFELFKLYVVQINICKLVIYKLLVYTHT